MGLSYEVDCGAEVARQGQLFLAKPTTFMNRSGLSVRAFAEKYGLEARHVLVVYDELHLPLGKLRLRAKGSPAGHRGMESVIENLQTTEVPRLRAGVGPQSGRGTRALHLG